MAESCVLVVDVLVAFALLHEVEVRASDMLGQHYAGLLHVLDHSSV